MTPGATIFLTVAGLHVLVGLVCVAASAIAMLSPKRSGRHRRWVRSTSGA